METLKQIIPLAVTASLFLMVVGIGLDATRDDLLHAFRRPAVLARTVLAVNVVVPAVAMVLIALTPISFAAKAGILFMAVSPAPALAPGKKLKVGGSKAYAYGVYLALVLLAVVVVPASVALLDAIYPAEIAIPPLAVARNVALTVLAPLALGLAVQRLAPALASKAAPVVGKVAMILLLVALIPILIGAWPAILALMGDGAGLTMAIVCLAALVAGHLLGGHDRGERAALAVSAATRHPGIALMIARETTADPGVQAAILLFLLIGLLVGAAYQAWLKRGAAGGFRLGRPG